MDEAAAEGARLWEPPPRAFVAVTKTPGSRPEPLPEGATIGVWRLGPDGEMDPAEDLEVFVNEGILTIEPFEPRPPAGGADEPYDEPSPLPLGALAAAAAVGALAGAALALLGVRRGNSA